MLPLPECREPSISTIAGLLPEGAKGANLGDAAPTWPSRTEN
jgi:hypothetical protein